MIKNNIMKTIKYLYVLFVFCGSYANAQYIIAGQHSSNDYYFKFTPDSNVISIPAYESTFYIHYYLLDVNNDGIMDFKFALYAPGSGMGAQLDFCTISGLNNNKVALGNYDTCFNYGNGYVERHGMAYAFHYNDTISFNANWDSLVYLSYAHQLGTPSDSQYFSCGTPNWSNTAYIGLRVKVDSLNEYGWIKIVGTTFTPYHSTTLTMGTFACENIGVGIKQPTSKNEWITVYPNPANNRIQVISGSSKIILISIYDMLGKEMINATEKEIDVSNLQEGIYFMQIKTSEGIATKKIIIQH